MGKLAGKKLLLLGERDGVGAEIVFSATECFV